METVTFHGFTDAAEKLNLKKIFETTNIIEKCVKLCNQYGRTSEEMLREIDAFLLNTGRETLTIDLVDSVFSSKLLSNFGKDISALGKRVQTAVVTPQQWKYRKIAEEPLSQRTKGHNIVQSFHGNLGGRGDFHPSQMKPFGQRCRVHILSEDFENLSHRYRHMYTSNEERLRAMEKRILRLQQAMCQLHGIDENLVVPVGEVSPNAVWICGLICCDNGEGRINKSSIVLEGSRRESGGRRILLDLTDPEIGEYSFFSGQIVLVQGINSGGKKFAVKRVIMGAPLPGLKSPARTLLEYHHSPFYQKADALTVSVACGPFTTSDNLNYQPLKDLLWKVLQSKPDLLILVGPFVDISHPALIDGDVALEEEDENGEMVRLQQCSYEMVFTMRIVRDCITAMFNEEEAENLATNIVLIPSLLDAHHEMVFPQPPFGDKEEVQTDFFEEKLGVLNIPFSNDKDPKKRVHLMPNPCMFRVNEVLFGVCSADVLFSMSTEEVNNMESGNRVVRLASHLLAQQSFVPQHPFHSSVPLQMDFRHMANVDFEIRPDVLVLPSKLAAFARDIETTAVVNPGFVTKGNVGGTFAELFIHPLPEERLSSSIDLGVEVSHEISSRTSVNIVKL